MNQEGTIKKTVEQTLETAIPYFERAIKQAADAAAKTGAKAAINTIEKERKKVTREWHDRRLRNTKLLLQNYRRLIEHYENAVYDAATLEEEYTVTEMFELMSQYVYDNDLYVESIKKSAARTHIIMEHLLKMLELYKVYCNEAPRGDYKRRWRVIVALYLAEKPSTVERVAAQEHVAERTIYRDIDAVCEELSALLFGIDGIKR